MKSRLDANSIAAALIAALLAPLAGCSGDSTSPNDEGVFASEDENYFAEGGVLLNVFTWSISPV
jgi:hypothetical protein